MAQSGGKSLGAPDLTALPGIGEDFVRWNSARGDDQALGNVEVASGGHGKRSNSQQWVHPLPLTAAAPVGELVDLLHEMRE